MNNDLMIMAKRYLSTSRDRKSAELIRQLMRELEQSYTFEEFVDAAKRDNKKNLGQGRKLSVWLNAIEKELENE